MKKICSLLVILTIFNCRAQTNIINIPDRYNYNNTLNYDNGSLYLKDVNNLMNPYIGTWKWTEGNKELILTLIKQKHHYNSPSNYYKDRLVGYYVYKENGVTLINTSNENLNSSYEVSVVFDLNATDLKITAFTFRDIPKKKDYEVWLELVSPTQMKFHGKIGLYSITYHPRKETIIYPGTSFPLNMTFTKQ